MGYGKQQRTIGIFGHKETKAMWHNNSIRVNIVPTSKANKRTKERIAQHGPTFDMEDFDTPSCMNGVPSVYLRSDDGWFGWIEQEHIRWTNPWGE